MKATVIFCSTALIQCSLWAGWHELLLDNGFEEGSSTTHWSAYALPGGDPLSAGIINLGNAHIGSWYAYLGDFSSTHHNAIGAVRQIVTIPAGATTANLNLAVNVTSLETTTTQPYDVMGAYLRTYPGDVQVITFHEWSNLNKDPGGVPNNYLVESFPATVSAYAGQQMVFQFYAQTDSSLSTTFRVDDLSLQVYVTDYTITASAGQHGTVSPSGTFSAEYAQTITFNATPDTGYAVDTWYVNGNPTGAGSSTLLLGVNGNTTVSVTFARITYTVSVSAGQNGTVSPNGNVTVNSGDTLTMTASPAQYYTVDQWSVSGSQVQNGGTTFSLANVSQNQTVLVTFKPILCTVTFTAQNGSVQVQPAATPPGRPPGKNLYAAGTILLLLPIPDAGFAFAQWAGDILGVAQPFSLLVDSDKAITANFVQQAPPPPITITPPPNPGSSFSFQIPTISGWRYLVRISRNNGMNWSYLTALDGTGGIVTVTDNNAMAHRGGLYTVFARPSVAIPPFLLFPVANNSPSSAPVTAIFDNDTANPANADRANGGILLFTGQLLTFDPDRCMRLPPDAALPIPCNDYTLSGLIGYRQDPAGHDVYLPINYNAEDPTAAGPKGTIWYDGHTGYDYAFGTDSQVIAAAGGVIDPETSWNYYRQIVISHPNGFKSYYVHLSSWEPAIQVGATVTAGMPIGHPGNIDAHGNPHGPIHLHFTLKKTQTDGQLLRVDPYGLLAEDQTQVEPPLWLP